MDKKRKLLLGLIITVIVLLIGFIIYYVGSFVINYINLTKDSKKIVTEFNEIYESDEKQVILFARPTCAYCKKFVPISDEIKKEENINYYYLNISSLTKKDLNMIIDKTGAKLNGVPHLVIIEKKKILGELSGYNKKETVIELFKKTGVIKGDV